MSLTCDIVRTTDALVALKDEWTSLLGASRICTPFLTWEWMCTWWQCYCDRSPHRHLAVIVTRQDGNLVGILPGYLRTTYGLTTYEFLGTEYESTDYTRPIVRPDARRAVFAAQLEALATLEPRPDILHLTNILETDETLDDLREFARRAGKSFEHEPFRICPFVPVQGDWEAFVERLSAKMRKNVRRAMRQLEDAGAEFTQVSRREDVKAAVHDLFALHADRFEMKKATTGFRADLREPFHVAVSERFLDAGMLRLFRLTIKDQLLATVYCFEHAGGLFYFQGGMNPEFEKLSVGTSLVGHAIKYAFDRQLDFFDFMRGDEPYKFRWTQHTRAIVAARLGTSLRGRATLFGRRRLLEAKGVVKRVVYRNTRKASLTEPAGA